MQDTPWHLASELDHTQVCSGHKPKLSYGTTVSSALLRKPKITAKTSARKTVARLAHQKTVYGFQVFTCQKWVIVISWCFFFFFFFARQDFLEKSAVVSLLCPSLNWILTLSKWHTNKIESSSSLLLVAAGLSHSLLAATWWSCHTSFFKRQILGD